MNKSEQVQEIFVEDIIPNRFQPRLTFDEKALQELSDSIKAHGVIQPLVLRKVGNKYEIIAGERRYKASCMAGLKQVPAIVREMTDDESAEVALIENVQRKNLTSIEEAQSYKNLLDRGYMTQEELANKIGVSQPTIANKMRLLNLCDEVQDALLNEKISERHARSLLQIENPDEQKKMLNRIIKERLTVKQLDNEIKKLLQGNNSDNNEGDAKIMEPAVEQNNQVPEQQPVNRNIFGFDTTPPTDLEASAPNLDTQVNDTIPPISFNPFNGGDMQTSLDDSLSQTSTVETNTPVTEPTPTEEPTIETFDMFGDIIKPQEELVGDGTSDASSKNIGDQINNVRDAIKTIETNGFVVEAEEYDFEDMYQIVIKIKK